MHGFFSRTEAYREEGARFFFGGIGNCSYSRGILIRIALAILGAQRADVAFFLYIFCPFLSKNKLTVSSKNCIIENRVFLFVYRRAGGSL